MRKAIGGACITSQGGVYTLNLQALYGEDVWYDVAAFEQHYDQAKQALKARQAEQVQQHFQQMVDLYQGEYVQSFYSNWCLVRRDQLRQWYLDARRELARIAWGKEQWEHSLAHWQHLLALDGYAEEAHYGVMCCYVRLGKRSQAVRQYQRCSEVFKSELAATPGPALQKLYHQLIHHS